ncbi:DUF2798 domain-containing protein [Pontibacter mangrovi]|nr:DUF2798 domain-containing protein [Pontibacter mangrovi]
MKPQLRRKLQIIAVLSLLLALALELYTFGMASDFPLRLLRSFFVLFMLVALLALAIVPGVSKAANKVLK